MTNFMKRILGTIATLAGLAGIAFASLAVWYVWETQRLLNVEVPETLKQVRTIVHSVHQQSMASRSLLDTTRQHLASIRIPIHELAVRNRQLSNADILATLDEKILERMENVEHFSLSLQDSMRSMSNALRILDSLPFLAVSASVKNPHPQPHQWRQLANSLTETADLLGQASQSLMRIRSGQDVAPQQMAQLAEVLNQMDRHIEEVQAHIQQFSATAEQTDAAVTNVETIAPAWIDRSAIALTVFFVCFGFSQLSVILHGWQLLK